MSEGLFRLSDNDFPIVQSKQNDKNLFIFCTNKEKGCKVNVSTL